MENTGEKLVKELIEIQLFQNQEHDYNSQQLAKLYSVVGLDLFVQLIMAFDGEEVKLPKSKEFHNIVQTAMAYYYKHFSDYEWGDSIKNFEREDIPNYKTRARTDKLDKIITDYIKNKQQELINKGN